MRSLDQEASRKVETPSEWIEKFFYVYDPRDPITGDKLAPGPIRLADHQKRIIDEALSRDDNGNFKYSTIIYSAPKKSGKSALTSAVALYMGVHTPFANIYCLANDGEQSSDRLYQPIKTCFLLHNQLNGPFKNIKYALDEVTLPNHTKIEAVPCNAAGQAGAQPLATFWSEMWAFNTPLKQRLWVEMTIPPTLHGKAIRWVETYAGHSGESELLEQLYDLGVRNGTPHPDFLELVGRDGPVVRTNERAKLFVYWDTEPRMPWQSDDFYQEQAATMPPSEFRRVHRNEWVSAASAFVEEGWWDACENPELPPLPLHSRTPVVVSIDMAVTRDCAAIAAVTRDPFEPDAKVAIRAIRIFSPAAHGGIIDQEALIRPVLEDWYKRWNIICWAYDPHQMAKLAQDMMRAGYGWFKPFGQVQPRSISDKQLHDMILHRQISWNRLTTEDEVGFKGMPGQTLYNHITHAGVTTSSGNFRIDKLADSLKVDGAVAVSQAVYMAMQLAIGNVEHNPENLVRLLKEGKITVDEFTERIKVSSEARREAIHASR